MASCVAHYIHFWHLLTVALRYGIPYVRIEALLSAPTVNDVMRVLEKSRICAPAGSSSADDGHRHHCQLIAEKILHGRQDKTQVHSKNTKHLASGTNFTAELYRQKEQRFLNETFCHDALRDLIAFCGDNIPGCRSVNEAYGYDDPDGWLLKGKL